MVMMIARKSSSISGAPGWTGNLRTTLRSISEQEENIQVGRVLPAC